MLVWTGNKPNPAPSGEPKTGFIEGEHRGAYNCGNCVHRDGNHCEHPTMVKLNKTQPRDAKGYPEVDGDDCCEFQRRPGD